MTRFINFVLILAFALLVMPVVAQDDAEETSEDVIVHIFISADGGTTWVSTEADTIEVSYEADVLVRFIVLNNSDTLLTNIELSATSFDIAECDTPTELAVGANFDCVAPIEFDGDDIEGNLLSLIVTGDLDGVAIVINQEITIQAVEGSVDDADVIIVIEGPVSAIVANEITIYNFTIAIAEDDPILTVLEIGDVIRIEGNWDDEDAAIVAIIVGFVTVDVFVFEGDVWRDNGNCSNGPPPWAPAHGWHARCEGNNSNGNANGNSNGRGNGNANGNSNGRGR